jgi:hypothetical protein
MSEVDVGFDNCGLPSLNGSHAVVAARTVMSPRSKVRFKLNGFYFKKIKKTIHVHTWNTPV